MRKAAGLAAVAAALCSLASAARADDGTWKYTDPATGVVTYSSQPPKGQRAQRVQLPDYRRPRTPSIEAPRPYLSPFAAQESPAQQGAAQVAVGAPLLPAAAMPAGGATSVGWPQALPPLPGDAPLPRGMAIPAAAAPVPAAKVSVEAAPASEAKPAEPKAGAQDTKAPAAAAAAAAARPAVAAPSVQAPPAKPATPSVAQSAPKAAAPSAPASAAKAAKPGAASASAAH
jgi:hypothetical protein